MELKENTTRTTKIRLTNDEFEEAIRLYLIGKNIRDANQHLVFDPIHTHDDRGLELDITLNNYNKENNIHD